MLVRKLASCVGFTWPFSDSTKDLLAREIPLPAKVNDLTSYNQVTNEIYPARKHDEPLRKAGWEVMQKGTLQDPYGNKFPTAASVVVFVPEQITARNLIPKAHRMLLTEFSFIGMPTTWDTAWTRGEDYYGNTAAWCAYRLLDEYSNSGISIIPKGKGDALKVNAAVELKIYDSHKKIKDVNYARHLALFYQELLRRTEYYRKNALPIFRIF